MATWRHIPGAPSRYEVSDEGEVRTIRYGRQQQVMNPFLTRYGYFCVKLFYSAGHIKFMKVHTLVTLAFYGPRPEGMVVRHLNDVKTDNRLVNLRYGTISENQRDAVKNGINPWSRRTHCKNGHEFTPENTRQRNDRGRRCVTCIAMNNARRNRSKRAVAA